MKNYEIDFSFEFSVKTRLFIVISRFGRNDFFTAEKTVLSHC